MFIRHRAPVGVLLYPLLMLAVSAFAAAPEFADENAVKAAFVYNFAKFTEWPDETWNRTPQLRLCVAGTDEDLTQAIANLESKATVRGKPLQVRRLAGPEEAPQCHILVLTGRIKPQPWLLATSGNAVLTVGEGEAFNGAGGMIGLYLDNDKVRFDASVDAAQRAGLRLSSQILRLARQVRDSSKGSR